MAKVVDAFDLGSCVDKHAGSSPATRNTPSRAVGSPWGSCPQGRWFESSIGAINN